MTKPKAAHIPTTGAIGTPPPPGAPIHERNEPLSPDLIAEQLRKAQANEQVLEPLNPVPQKPPLKAVQPSRGKTILTPTKATPMESSVADELARSLASRAVDVPPPALDPVIDTGTDPGDENDAPEMPEAEPVAAPQALQPRRPAESNTDSPSRGVPRPIGDPGKAITGGFGVQSMQYFALDGTEIRALLTKTIDRLKKQMEADLRFGIAITYPQVRLRVSIHLDGATLEAAVNDVAFSLAEAEILHLDAVDMDDEATPPDALRDEAGLERPYKRLVMTGAGRQFADREVK